MNLNFSPRRLRRFSQIKFLLVSAICALCALCGQAQNNITLATIAITNAPTTNGQTLVINGVTRTWTNSVVVPAVQILTNATAAGAATNLFNQLSLNPVPGGTSLSYGSSTSVVVRSFPAQTLTLTLSAGWGLVTYTTNALTTAIAVRVPNTVEGAAQRTNISTELVNWLNLTAPTNQLEQSKPAMAQLLGTTNAQTITGAKTFLGTLLVSNAAGIFEIGTIHATNYTGDVGAFTNGIWWNAILRAPILTNGVNYGNAFRSPGSASGSEQFGTSAVASGGDSIAFGLGASATEQSASAFGNLAYAGGALATALGYNAFAAGAGGTALGAGAYVDLAAPVGTAIGGAASVNSGHTNSTALGYLSSTTKKNQIMIGSATHVVTIPGSIEHLTTTGTNSFSDIAFRRYAITSLANGNNAGVIIGTNSFVEVSGPSGAFTINGMTGSPSRDGHLVVIVNQTGFDMTVAHQSGTDPVAANRIISLTGADRTTTGNGAATLLYSAAAARWILIAFDP